MRSPAARDAAEGRGAPDLTHAEIQGLWRAHGLLRKRYSTWRPETGTVWHDIAMPTVSAIRSLLGPATDTEGGEAQGAVEMRDACLRLCYSALYGPPSSWPGDFPHGWKPPLSWDPGRAPTPEEAALHDNGVTDAWIAILTGTRDEQGNPRVPQTPAVLNRVGGGGESGGEDG